ncbi:hypothetical protein AB0D12_04520 [Streptomyces sp. NPDC048479]|uniref:hypothetical protein n=1 Tax=Streptomyces sp. NPDC048479 TaxID=3154725 RepID=UPI003431F508
MTFDDEWAQLKSGTQDQQPVEMRLNQTEPDTESAGSAANADLVVHQDDLGAVGNEAFRLHGDLQKKADIAGAGMSRGGAGSTAQAASELSGHHLTMGDELSTTLEVWGTQVKTVLQMCAHISNHLDYSKKAHAKDEVEIAAALKHRDGSAMSVSEISKYVK